MVQLMRIMRAARVIPKIIAISCDNFLKARWPRRDGENKFRLLLAAGGRSRCRQSISRLSTEMLSCGHYYPSVLPAEKQ